MADKRTSDADLSLDCNTLILDLIVYRTTASLLRAQRTSLNGRVSIFPDMLNELQMVESFIVLLTSAHASSSTSFPSTTLFRLQLLRFATLFGLRHERTVATPSYAALLLLRQENRNRADQWHVRESIHDPSFEQLYHSHRVENARTHSYMDRVIEDKKTQTLLDLIPSLIDLTASRARVGAFPATESSTDPNDIDNDDDNDDTNMDIQYNTNDHDSMNPSWATTTRWLELVAEMMLHAVLERDRNHPGFPSIDSIYEAFAWGPPSKNQSTAPPDFHTTGFVPDSQEADGIEYHDLLFMLGSESNEPGARWRAIRTQYLNYLVPPTKQMDMAVYMRKLAAKHPLEAFEAQMFAFLHALHKGLETPVLVQLECAEEDDGDGDGEGGQELDSIVVDGIAMDVAESQRLRRLFKTA